MAVHRCLRLAFWFDKAKSEALSSLSVFFQVLGLEPPVNSLKVFDLLRLLIRKIAQSMLLSPASDNSELIAYLSKVR